MENRFPVWPWHEGAPTALLSELSEALTAQLADGPLFLLVDPLVRDLPEPLEVVYKRHDLPGDDWRLPANKLAYLVEINDARDPLLAQSVGWAVDEHLQALAASNKPDFWAYSIGGWLQPHAPGNGITLARQLDELFKAKGAPDGISYLRLADRRVLDLLRRAPKASVAVSKTAPLQPVNWAQQLQGIAAWVYLDANFGLQRISAPDGEPAQGPLRLDSAHWMVLLKDAESVTSSLTAWQAGLHPLPDDALEQVLQALVRAHQHGLRDPDDRAAYAAEALLRPAFEQWNQMADYVAYCQKGRQPFAVELPALRNRWTAQVDG